MSVLRYRKITIARTVWRVVTRMVHDENRDVTIGGGNVNFQMSAGGGKPVCHFCCGEMRVRSHFSARAHGLTQRERKKYNIQSDAELVEQVVWKCGCRDVET